MTADAFKAKVEDSRFYLTGSDFSELAILNYSMNEELNK